MFCKIKDDICCPFLDTSRANKEKKLFTRNVLTSHFWSHLAQTEKKENIEKREKLDFYLNQLITNRSTYVWRHLRSTTNFVLPGNGGGFHTAGGGGSAERALVFCAGCCCGPVAAPVAGPNLDRCSGGDSGPPPRLPPSSEDRCKMNCTSCEYSPHLCNTWN